MIRRKILIVDDDDVARKLLQEILEKDGFEVQLASSGEEAISFSKKFFFPVVVSDIRMLELDGIDVLKHYKSNSPKSVVILMTAFGSMDSAVQAIKEGAFDYISKPFKIDEFKSIIKKALKQAESLQQIDLHEISPSLQEKDVKAMIGSSVKMLEIYKTLARSAMSDVSVLITGESGTGKELIARAIHENSVRKKKKFIAINCGSLSETLLESELFGHVKGSFTGAQDNRKGIIEEANDSTLFLDEIGDISLAMQVKLLRVLQEGEIRPVGSNESKKVNVRLIAATHRNLSQMVRESKFREDLYYRLKVVSIAIPPLRERPEDIPDLANHFLLKYSEKNKKRFHGFSKDVLNQFKFFQWPGNVRQLENTIEHAVAMSNSTMIELEDLPPEIRQQEINSSLLKNETEQKRTLEDLEKIQILKILSDVNFNKSRAAEILGIDRTTLYRKAQKYGIELKEK